MKEKGFFFLENSPNFPKKKLKKNSQCLKIFEKLFLKQRAHIFWDLKFRPKKMVPKKNKKLAMSENFEKLFLKQRAHAQIFSFKIIWVRQLLSVFVIIACPIPNLYRCFVSIAMAIAVFPPIQRPVLPDHRW